MVSTQDSESCDPSSNLGETCIVFFSLCWEFSSLFSCMKNAQLLQKIKAQSRGNLIFVLVFNLDFQVNSCHRFRGVMVSTLDFDSSDPSSNLGETFNNDLL